MRRKSKARSILAPILGLSIAAIAIASGEWVAHRTPDQDAPSVQSPVLEQTPAPADLSELRLYALDLMNRDRRAHGVEPVTLGHNDAAQSHAEDMLKHRYIGHWWVDGRKPYMVYSESGGDSYAAENVAISTYPQDAARCESGVSVCIMKDSFEVIRTAQYNMMYDDAHADWGHRDNILRPGHRSVSIGIAVSPYFVSFVQHFHGGAATALTRPTLNEGVLSIRLLLNEPNIDIHRAVSVFYDPEPSPQPAPMIDRLDSYCTGGGFTTDCPDRAFVVLPPLEEGWYYPDLGPDEIVAHRWEQSGNLVAIEADAAALATKPGVYTVVVFRATDGPSEVLVSLTVNLQE